MCRTKPAGWLLVLCKEVTEQVERTVADGKGSKLGSGMRVGINWSLLGGGRQVYGNILETVIRRERVAQWHHQEEVGDCV